MIFGFNTDIKSGDTVYHVQSEVRRNDQTLQTQVFVKGRCVGKRTSRYEDQGSYSKSADEQIHDLLKAQHRLMLDGIREGILDSLFGASPPNPSSSVPCVAEVHVEDGGPLRLEWTNSECLTGQSEAFLRFALSDVGGPISGARITSRLDRQQEAPVYSQALTDAAGNVEIPLSLPDSSMNTTLLVQASAEGRSVARKFRFCRR